MKHSGLCDATRTTRPKRPQSSQNRDASALHLKLKSSSAPAVRAMHLPISRTPRSKSSMRPGLTRTRLTVVGVLHGGQVFRVESLSARETWRPAHTFGFALA